MKEKKLLIVERSGSAVSCSSEPRVTNNGTEESIVLTGIFTTFNEKNRNGRVYESADFLPHVEALKETIKNSSLLGELDHPHGFEITLANASHVIESLEFDQQRNAIIGKIRLLNTAKGKDAQALVRDGIPLHISSRAAGTVDESGRVRLQQLFTYDLVADPGFANAVLSRVNEGVEANPISNETRRILNEMNESYQQLNESMSLVSKSEGFEAYEVSETNTELLPEPGREGNKIDDFGSDQQKLTKDKIANNGTIDDNNKNNNMDNGNFISYADFQKYTENLSEIIAELQSAIANYKTELESVKAEKEGTKPTQTFEDGKTDNGAISALVADSVDAKVAEVEEKYENLKKYTMYLAEQLDNSITHQDYIVEEANKMIAHQDYIVEEANKMIAHQDYIVENLNDTIGYQNYIAEMLDKSIDYSNMIAEEHNKTIAHSDYLAEKMNQMIEHQDYIVENANKMIAHADYIVEGMNKMVEHNDYIVEHMNEMSDNINAINEGKTVSSTVVEENVETPAVEEKVETPAVEEKEVFDSVKYQNGITEMLGNLINTVKTQYAETKQKEVETLEESRKAIDNAEEFKLVNYIPERLKERWSNLSDERKKEILSESKMLVINDVFTAQYFWNTRDLRETKIEMKKVEEQVTAQPANNNQLNENLSDRQKMMSEMIKHRMRR